MPDMVGAIGGDDACGRRRLPRTGQWLFFQDPSHRRYPQMQSCPAQCLGDLDLSHAGVQGFQTLHDVADEVRELIHRLAQLQKCLGALVIDAFHPRCNRSLRNEKNVGRLFDGPASCGTKFEDRHAHRGRNAAGAEARSALCGCP